MPTAALDALHSCLHHATHCARPEGHCSSGLVLCETWCDLKPLGHGTLGVLRV